MKRQAALAASLERLDALRSFAGSRPRAGARRPRWSRRRFRAGARRRTRRPPRLFGRRANLTRGSQLLDEAGDAGGRTLSTAGSRIASPLQPPVPDAIRLLRHVHAEGDVEPLRAAPARQRLGRRSDRLAARRLRRDRRHPVRGRLPRVLRELRRLPAGDARFRRPRAARRAGGRARRGERRARAREGRGRRGRAASPPRHARPRRGCRRSCATCGAGARRRSSGPPFAVADRAEARGGRRSGRPAPARAPGRDRGRAQDGGQPRARPRAARGVARTLQAETPRATKRCCPRRGGWQRRSQMPARPPVRASPSSRASSRPTRRSARRRPQSCARSRSPSTTFRRACARLPSA